MLIFIKRTVFSTLAKVIARNFLYCMKNFCYRGCHEKQIVMKIKEILSSLATNIKLDLINFRLATISWMILIHALKQIIPLYPTHIITVNMLSARNIN
ncbi:MAG: hypothetical protein ACTS73_01340 [Arsenophonus sp. NEOnobi-MAG3]